MRVLVGVVAVAAMVVGSSVASASPISLSFATLPSSQGWTYTGNNSETSVFSVDGTSLLMDTVGLGPTEDAYILPGTVNTIDPFVFSVRAAVAETVNVSGSPGPQNGFFFEVRTASPNAEAYFGLTTTEVANASGTRSYALDATVPHTYTIAGVPDGVFNLYVDGTAVYSDSMGNLGGGALDGVEFGDNDSEVHESAQISCLSFSQPGSDLSACTAPVPVPEPASLWLVSVGAVTLLRRRGLRRQR